MRSKPIIKVKILGGAAVREVTKKAISKNKNLRGVIPSNITGSAFLVTVQQGDRTTRMAIDMGLVQTAPADFFESNLEILQHLDPASLDIVILTHAHTDHVSRLPMLVKHGFNGKIFCTYPTAHLLNIVLLDSAKIQTDFLRSINRKKKGTNSAKKEKKYFRDRGRLRHDRFNKKESFTKAHSEILYSEKDVEKTYGLVKNQGFGCYYHDWVTLAHNISLKFYHSGHVLGGAICIIKISNTESEDIILGFSGDLGREDGIILPPPEAIDEAVNFWVTESTYGGKSHPPREEEIQKLIAIVKDTAENKGVITIPSFALERTQEIIYILSYYMSIGEITEMPICLDAPLAEKITEIYAVNWDKGMFSDQHKLNFNPFDLKQNKWLKFIETSEQSRGLVDSPGPYIVIAGSGTCDAGRVRFHLQAGLIKEKNTVCLVGYMPESSLGRKLRNNPEMVRMNNIEIPIKAKIAVFDSFSAHADGHRLAAFTKSVIDNFTAKNKNGKQLIMINHGELSNASFLRDEIMLIMKSPRGLGERILIPILNEEFTIS